MRALVFADHESDDLATLRLTLNFQGYDIECVRDHRDIADRLLGADALDPLFVLLDLEKRIGPGLDALRDLRQIRSNVPIIVMSGIASPSDIVTAMKSGANDFLLKPFTSEDLSLAIARVLPHREYSTAESTLSRLRVMDDHEFSEGAWSRKIAQLLEHAGGTDVPLLLRGETGVGKEVLARKFHARSARARHPFLKLNCAALPSELVESELFGYERGAFTGAIKSTAGKFEMANGGTILLDEIGDMDFKVQAKLLQVLQDKEFMRLGTAGTTRVDVRVMAATHRDLEHAISAGTFREDLYYRLNIIDIQIPPLRERTDEILPLAEFFLRKHYTPDTPTMEIPVVLRRALLDHDWPGNIRELENVMLKFLVIRNAALVADELSHKRRKSKRAIVNLGPVASLNHRPNARDNASPEVAVILDALNSTQWDHARAAIQLGLDYDTLLRRMQELAIRQRPVRAAAAENAMRQDGNESAAPLSRVNEARKAAESEAIQTALAKTRWNRKEAAKLLGIDYKALLYKMKKLGIGDDPPAISPSQGSVPITEVPVTTYAPRIGDRFIA